MGIPSRKRTDSVGKEEQGVERGRERGGRGRKKEIGRGLFIKIPQHEFPTMFGGDFILRLQATIVALEETVCTILYRALYIYHINI